MSRESAAVEALKLHALYEATPGDRGGKGGPKGKALAAWIAARDAVLALASAPSGNGQAPTETTLEACEPGLFKFGDTIGFKSEYKTKTTSGYWQSDAYCVASGEYFWGGAPTSQDREALRVIPLTTEDFEGVQAADKARLDYLDRCNAALNAQYGTTYRWKLIRSHNVTRLMLAHRDGPMDVDLHDSEPHGLPSCRDAIDEAMRDSKGRTA